MMRDVGNRPPEERVESWKAFHRRENSRKLLGFFYGSEYPAKRYRSAGMLPEDRPLEPDDFPVAPYLDDFDRLHETMEAFPGDFLYSASAFWGIPWLEAALGCPVRVSHATGSLYAETPPGTGRRNIPDFDPRNPWLLKLVEFLQVAAKRSAGRYPLATTRMRGIADLLSALYGGEDLVFRMLDRPEEIRDASERLADFYIKVGNLQLEYIPPFFGGIGSFYYHLWAPAGTVWHQEDSCMFLSPDLYAKFIQDGDRRIFSAFRGNIMHFHSTGGYLPLDEVLKLRPTAVEMHIDSGGPSAKALFETHRKILADAPLIIWGALTREDFDWIFDKLPDQGVAVNAVVSDADEAKELWNRYIMKRGSI